MLKKLIAGLGRIHRCRNTRLEIATEELDGYRGQVIIRMIDKCTGAAYEAAYSPETADRIIAEIAAVSDSIRRASSSPQTPPPAGT